MKYLKCFAVMATAVMLASCGGSSKSESDNIKKAEENAEKTVTVKDENVNFTGELSSYAALVPGDYTLKLSDKSLDLEVTATVLDEAQTGVSGTSTLFILDENGNEVAEMILMGGQTELGDNIKNGRVDTKSTLSFSHYDDNASDIFKKAKYIKAGELNAAEESNDEANNASSG